MKKIITVTMMLFIGTLITGCGSSAEDLLGTSHTVNEETGEEGSKDGVSFYDEVFNGIWQKENSHLLLYVVGDGTVYMGDLGDSDDGLMCEENNKYIGEINGGKLYIINVKNPEMQNTYEQVDDKLVDEQGVYWHYVKDSTSLVRDE